MTPEESLAARERLAIALGYLRGRAAQQGILGVTLASSIEASIRRLDAEEDDALDGRPSRYQDSPSGVGKGQLQRIQEIRDTLLGPDGLLEALKAMEPPGE